MIGGTSLWGRRGARTYSALLGGLVIVSISNGMDLLGSSQSIITKFIVTGAVLLAAATVDRAVPRRGRQAAGRVCLGGTGSPAPSLVTGLVHERAR